MKSQPQVSFYEAYPPCLFIETGSLTGLEQGKLTINPQGSACLHLSSAEIRRATPRCPAFLYDVSSGDRTLILVFVQNKQKPYTLYQLAVFQALIALACV